jgi:hypothetical protein
MGDELYTAVEEAKAALKMVQERINSPKVDEDSLLSSLSSGAHSLLRLQLAVYPLTSPIRIPPSTRIPSARPQIEALRYLLEDIRTVFGEENLAPLFEKTRPIEKEWLLAIPRIQRLVFEDRLAAAAKIARSPLFQQALEENDNDS